MSALSVQARLAPPQARLTEIVRMLNEGTYPEGPEALHAEIETILEENHLWEDQIHQVDHIGVYPYNRVGAGLVAADSQGLLNDTFMENGWNPNKWDCVSLQVLDEWKKVFAGEPEVHRTGHGHAASAAQHLARDWQRLAWSLIFAKRQIPMQGCFPSNF